MTLVFTLSMPGRASWNSRWSGEERSYCIVKSFASKKAKDKAAKILERGYYSYGWSDGWRAGINVKQADSAGARKARKNSQGFCGYSWMVTSILEHGAIYASHDEIPKKVIE